MGENEAAITCAAVQFLDEDGSKRRALERRAIIGFVDGTLRMWSLDLNKLVSTMESHEMAVTGVSADWTGERCISCSKDATFMIWAFCSGQRMRTVRLCGPVMDMQVDWDRKRAMIACETGQMAIYNLDLWKELKVWEGHPDTTARCVCFE